MYTPAYLKSHRRGILKERKETAVKRLSNCFLCPRGCGVDRLNGEKGICRTGKRAIVASYTLHFGEEAPLVGRGGSGTIFFSRCNLYCIFCQNYDISRLGEGEAADDETLAAVMLSLQNQGAMNINLVTPSHVVPQILSALEIAAQNGLNLPLIYNSGGYDSVETLKLLDGIIDIYMPDFKTMDKDIAKKIMNAGDYPDKAKKALLEMHRQTGDLIMDNDGIAKRGVLLRHLVMPDNAAKTEDVMQFVAEKISKNTYVNIMPQYRPLDMSHKYPPIHRKPTEKEYNEAVQSALKAGVTRLDKPRRVFFAFNEHFSI